MTTYVTPDLTKTAQADTTTYNPTQANASTYNATNANASNYQGQGYDTTQWNVDAPQTVHGQIQGIIANNSPLMQMAKTTSLQNINGRGLLNSSMAIGEGQKALYSAALPIAQQDAQTYAQSNQFNANSANNAAQFKATADNQANQFNAQTNTQISGQNASAANQANQFNAQNQTQVSTQNANAANQASQFNAQQTNAQAQYNAGQINDQVKATLDQNNKLALMQVEAQYKTLMQANQSADSIYQQTIKNIADIQMNKDMTADTKTTMIQQQMTYLQTGMSLVSKLNSLPGLADLIKTA